MLLIKATIGLEGEEAVSKLDPGLKNAFFGLKPLSKPILWAKSTFLAKNKILKKKFSQGGPYPKIFDFQVWIQF